MGKVSAVRVEVDGHVDAPTLAEPVAPQPSGSRRWMFILGGIAIVVLVVALVALQPTEGETAAGTERGTTTTVAPTTTTATTVTTPIIPTVRRAGDRSASDVDVFSMVRDDSGFFALGRSEGLTLFRSLRGLEWQEVAIEVSEAAGPEEGTWTDYLQLIAVEDGFAVLRVREDFTQIPRTMEVDRLFSADGVVWDVDTSFESIAAERGDGWGFVHFADAVGVTQVDRAVDLEALLTGVFTESAGVDPANVCWIEPVGLNQIRTLPCEDATVSFGTDITATDLREPERFDALIECAVAINIADPLVSSTVIRGRAGTRVLMSEDGTFDHIEIGDGAIAALSLGNIYATGQVDSTACDSFDGGFPDLVTPAVELTLANGEQRRVPLPDDALPQDRDADPELDRWASPRLHGSGDRLFLLAGTGVWSLDQATDSWIELVDLPVPLTGFVDYEFSSAEQVVGLSNDSIIVADLVEGTVDRFEHGEDLGGWARLAYADDDLFLMEVEDGATTTVVAVDLPQ